jgi:hypothetical protein
MRIQRQRHEGLANSIASAAAETRDASIRQCGERGMRVVAAASEQRFLGAAEGSRVPLLALPALNDPLNASVTDDHAGLSVSQNGDDAGIVVGCLA